MALKDSINHYWRDIARKKATVVEVLGWSATGRNLQRECQLLSRSHIMRELAEALADKNGNPIDRFKMGQYLAQALEFGSDHNLQQFIDYLEAVTQKAESARRSDYYRRLKDAVASVAASNELAAYRLMYDDFKNDSSRPATLAKEIMDEIASATKKIMGEYA